MADLVWKGVHPLVFGHCEQLAYNKFFDSSRHSMRKINERYKKTKKKLRDVQQEREGTSLNYFKVFFNYIKQFFLSWSILV